jgi:LacI family transcriptional regulator
VAEIDARRATAGRRPTMKEVATLSGASISTVSRVLSGDTAVKPEHVTRVLDAVELLGYQRNDVASNLRRADRGSASIGLIVEDVANPFFSAAHRGVEDIARAHDVVTLAGSSDEDPQQERRLAAAFAARRVDGLIVVPAGDDHSYLLRERAAGMPLIFLDRPPRFLDADSVLTDNAGGARHAVEHLLASGHRRIAFLGGREPIHTAVERRRGYLDALRDHDIALTSELVCTDLHDAAAARQAARTLLLAPDPPSALFSAQNLLTIGAVQALHELAAHHTVAHVGFDDIPLSQVIDPGLTVIAQDPYALGRTAAELLFSRLHGDQAPYHDVILSTTLIARGSGEIAPPSSARTRAP